LSDLDQFHSTRFPTFSAQGIVAPWLAPSVEAGAVTAFERSMDFLMNDLRFAFRTLRKQPAFTATVIATLAFAIGASTAIFSVVDSTLLRPLPFRTPDRLVFLWGVAGPQRSIRGASIIEVQDWARLNRSFEDVSIYDETSLNLRTAEGADRVDAEMVSPSFFPMLGATPQLGRLFTADEDRVPDANPVVLISDGMWTSRFGRDPSIVGRTLTFNDKPFTVLGVMRQGFKGLSFDTDVWFPAMMARANGAPQDLTNRGTRWLGAVGRLKPGVSLAAAQADADRVGVQLARDFPQTNKDRGIQLFSLRDSYLGSTRNLVLAVFAAVGLLLLIACANVIGLQLVRASGRRREFALRMAIGAERARLIQQLVVEGLVLAVASAAVGLIIAAWGLRALVAVTPAGLLPNYATPSINLSAFAFALVAAVGCGVVFGLVPAIRGSRIALTDSLKEGARGSSAGFGRGARLGSQQLLVVGEAAVALILLVGAGLYVRSLQKQIGVPLGFDPRGVVRARFSFPQSYTPAARLQLINQLETRVAALPSVHGLAIGSDLPLGGESNASIIHIPDDNQSVRYYRHSVAPEYFRALGVRVVAGRGFTAEDRTGMPATVMINESMARRFWQEQSPIGKVVRLGDATGPEATIVGVVSDVRQRDLTTPLATTEPDIYFPLAQRTPGSIELGVRSDLPVETTSASLRRELAALDPTFPLFAVTPLESLLAQQTAGGRFASTILTVFGAAALVLTAIGLYGVLAFLVSLRTREIGIRIALGATQARVSNGIITQGVALVVVGAVVGSVIAAFLARWIASQLFGVGAHDPIVFGAVPIALVVIAAIASWVPARRAARVDPQIALRSE
jgi:putative ABC transport system permease protein